MLRCVCAGDAGALLAIYTPYVRETFVTFETEVPSEADFSARIADLSSLYPYLVWEEGGRVRGYAYAHAYHARAAYRFSVELSVYVARWEEGRGVGKKLYAALLSLLRAQGYRTAYAVIALPNERSVALHESFGFTEAGTMHRAGYKYGGWRDTLILELPLSVYPDEPEEPVPFSALPAETVRAALAEAERI